MTINLPHNMFSDGRWQMFDRYARAIKLDYIDYWLKENKTFEALPMGTDVNIPDSTNKNLTYLLRVAHIDHEWRIVTFEWVGTIK